MQLNFTANTVVETISNNSKHLLICLHGYGQLARYFIKKFEGLKNCDVWAVQAPNLFYLEGFTGRIGANWLTKENREQGIYTQLEILKAIKQKVEENAYTSVDLCGFSQGVATASRWLMWDEIKFNKVLFYAGEIAPEALVFLADAKVNNIKMCVGNNDEFFTNNKILLYQNHLKSKNVDIKIEVVNGSHSLNTKVLIAFFE